MKFSIEEYYDVYLQTRQVLQQNVNLNVELKQGVALE